MNKQWMNNLGIRSKPEKWMEIYGWQSEWWSGKSTPCTRIYSYFYHIATLLFPPAISALRFSFSLSPRIISWHSSLRPRITHYPLSPLASQSLTEQVFDGIGCFTVVYTTNRLPFAVALLCWLTFICVVYRNGSLVKRLHRCFSVTIVKWAGAVVFFHFSKLLAYSIVRLHVKVQSHQMIAEPRDFCIIKRSVVLAIVHIVTIAAI